MNACTATRASRRRMAFPKLAGFSRSKRSCGCCPQHRAVEMLRRCLLKSAALAALPRLAAAQASLLTRPIPSSGEHLPVVGLGTWITFNVGQDAGARRDCAQVMRNFLELGGRLVDSSPMYGSSQEVVGDALARLNASDRVFA